MILVSSQRFLLYFYYYRLRNLLTVLFVSCDLLAISRLFSVVVYTRRRDFIHSESVIQSIVQSEIVECSKKALFCGGYCDRNQAIILVVLVSLIFI